MDWTLFWQIVMLALIGTVCIVLIKGTKRG